MCSVQFTLCNVLFKVQCAMFSAVQFSTVTVIVGWQCVASVDPWLNSHVSGNTCREYLTLVLSENTCQLHLQEIPVSNTYRSTCLIVISHIIPAGNNSNSAIVQRTKDWCMDACSARAGSEKTLWQSVTLGNHNCHYRNIWLEWDISFPQAYCHVLFINNNKRTQ